ncbi:AT hook domain-containing protein [Colletotrichum incanum]|nr:AT hook domain-containing protein [Colletotrichum incanum]
MAPARVIADSDDSDDDFDVGDSPLKPPTSKIPSEDRSSDPIQTKKDSTTTSSPTSITEPVMGFNGAKGKKAEVVDLTQGKTPGRSVSTTPKDMWDVPSSPADNQAAPLFIPVKTGTPGSSKKRKREDNIEFNSSLAVAMPSQGSTQPFDVTPAARRNTGSVRGIKRLRHENPESSLPAEDDVDMVVVPCDADVPSFTDLVSGQKPVSLCIEPQTLSASQRLEYEYHSVNPSPEDQGPLPTQPFSTLPATARSSGATTIAYSTPSQTRVVGLPLVPFADHAPLGTVQEQTQEAYNVTPCLEATVEIQSSPDIISAAPVRRKRDRADRRLPQAAEAHQDNEGGNPDDIGFLHGIYKSRLSRRRGSDACLRDQTENLEKTDVPVADMGPAAQLPAEDPAPASPPKPKKRGRPRKPEAAALAPTVTVETSASLQAGELSDVTKGPTGVDIAAATQQTNKKRGRPRKANKAGIASAQQDPEEQGAAEAATPHDGNRADAAIDEKHTKEVQPGERAKASTGRRGDKKQDSIEPAVETSPTADGPQERGKALVLQPVTPNAASKPGSDGLGPQIAAAERKVAADSISVTKDEDKAEVVGKANKSKSLTTPASLAGKPIYRVGLSKKSRIAPLLKSLRK